MATARLSQATARGVSDSLGIMGPARKAREPASGATTVALSSSPGLASGGDSGMLVRMRAVLHRHQCGSEQEAVSVCMRSARIAGQPPVASASCERYINALRYCEHATQHHNFPSFANAMY
uniref:Uncharacterized protein n=1 Tax=Tetradesmus obliquus TaxID=3088 RepID=A0A383VQD3_TETOB|eukprot:jgi/Sobl393_1/14687/SZX67103.1